MGPPRPHMRGLRLLILGRIGPFKPSITMKLRLSLTASVKRSHVDTGHFQFPAVPAIKVDALPPAMWPPDSGLPAALELRTSAWREAPSCFVLLSDKQAAARCLCLGPSSTGPHAHSRLQLPLWFYWRGK